MNLEVKPEIAGQYFRVTDKDVVLALAREWPVVAALVISILHGNNIHHDASGRSIRQAGKDTYQDILATISLTKEFKEIIEQTRKDIMQQRRIWEAQFRAQCIMIHGLNWAEAYLGTVEYAVLETRDYAALHWQMLEKRYSK